MQCHLFGVDGFKTAKVFDELFDWNQNRQRFLKDFSDQIRQNHVFNGNVGKT